MNIKVDIFEKPITIDVSVIFSSINKGLYAGRVTAITDIMVTINGYNKNYPQDLLVIKEVEYALYINNTKNK